MTRWKNAALRAAFAIVLKSLECLRVEQQIVEIERRFHDTGVLALGVDVDEHMAAVAELALDDLLGDAVNHLALDEPLQRTRAEDGVEAVDGQVLHGGGRNVERDPA